MIQLNDLTLQELSDPSHLVLKSYGVLKLKFIYKTRVMSFNQTAVYLFEIVYLAYQSKSFLNNLIYNLSSYNLNLIYNFSGYNLSLMHNLNGQSGQHGKYTGKYGPEKLHSLTFFAQFKFSYSLTLFFYFRRMFDPSNQNLEWQSPPKNVLIIKKPSDSQVTEKFKSIAKWLIEVRFYSLRS